MTRQERFEKVWAEQHAVPVESLAQYRWITQDGYRLPDMAAHYRTFCQALESVVVELPAMNPSAGRLVTTLAKSMHNEYVKAIEASGARVTQ